MGEQEALGPSLAEFLAVIGFMIVFIAATSDILFRADKRRSERTKDKWQQKKLK